MLDKLKANFKGDIAVDEATLETYSHDTSLFEVVPKAVLFPKSVEDVRATVDFVRENKATNPELSITPRSGGTDMSGGAINDSLIMAFSQYFNHIGEVNGENIVVQPGAKYSEFEKKTLAKNKLMPSYPASKDLCDVGGMVANRAGGEKSLIYGTTEKYVKRLKVVLRDGKEYEFAPLNKAQLDEKLKLEGLEGDIYREVYKLLDSNYQEIIDGRPPVSKNTTGYALWDVWDKKAGVFDMTKLFVGSQGTLGIITEIEMSLVDNQPYSGLLVGYVPSLDNLGELIKEVVSHGPSSFETFDDHTLKFAIRFFLKFRKTLGWGKFIKLGLSFIPDVLLMFKDVIMGRGLPKLIMLVEYEGANEEEIDQKLTTLRDSLHGKGFNITLEKAGTESKSERFWLMRRESFNLLRKNLKGDNHTAPYIDDLIVPPKNLPEFLPEFKEILERYKLNYTIAGHMGDGNFHVIPIMDFAQAEERAKIEPSLKECIALVKKYDGSISGEHNDGLVRGPFLKLMYGDKMFSYFTQIKQLFDPDNIFNPHKKTDAKWEYSKAHMREHF